MDSSLIHRLLWWENKRFEVTIRRVNKQTVFLNNERIFFRYATMTTKIYWLVFLSKARDKITKAYKSLWPVVFIPFMHCLMVNYLRAWLKLCKRSLASQAHSSNWAQARQFCQMKMFSDEISFHVILDIMGSRHRVQLVKDSLDACCAAFFMKSDSLRA